MRVPQHVAHELLTEAATFAQGHEVPRPRDHHAAPAPKESPLALLSLD
jgi:hypothetical protein